MTWISRKYSGGTYLKVGDVRDEPRRVTIEKVKPGDFDKADLHFTDGSILSLNATNTRGHHQGLRPRQQ